MAVPSTAQGCAEEPIVHLLNVTATSVLTLMSAMWRAVDVLRGEEHAISEIRRLLLHYPQS